MVYRPGRSAHQALSATRERCWRQDWVLDLDIKGFFDNIDHELMMRAVRCHTNCRWTLLYIERWLKASVQLPSGEVVKADKGTPQGVTVFVQQHTEHVHLPCGICACLGLPDVGVAGGEVVVGVV